VAGVFLAMGLAFRVAPSATAAVADSVPLCPPFLRRRTGAEQRRPGPPKILLTLFRRAPSRPPSGVAFPVCGGSTREGNRFVYGSSPRRSCSRRPGADGKRRRRPPIRAARQSRRSDEDSTRFPRDSE